MLGAKRPTLKKKTQMCRAIRVISFFFRERSSFRCVLSDHSTDLFIFCYKSNKKFHTQIYLLKINFNHLSICFQT